MKTIQAATALSLALALIGGVVSAPAYAALPSEPGNVKVMDTNKNGKVEKDEYLAFMAKRFDQTAGNKGYCSFEEIESGFRDLERWTYSVN